MEFFRGFPLQAKLRENDDVFQNVYTTQYDPMIGAGHQENPDPFGTRGIYWVEPNYANANIRTAQQFPFGLPSAYGSMTSSSPSSQHLGYSTVGTMYKPPLMSQPAFSSSDAAFAQFPSATAWPVPTQSGLGPFHPYREHFQINPSAVARSKPPANAALLNFGKLSLDKQTTQASNRPSYIVGNHRRPSSHTRHTQLDPINKTPPSGETQLIHTPILSSSVSSIETNSAQASPVTVNLVRMSDLARSASELNPRLGKPELIIVYDKAKKCFPVHQTVLCAHSEVFSRAFDGPFKECEKNMIRLTNEFPFAVKAMCDFMYEHSYDLSTYWPEMTKRFERVTEMEFHILVYAVADKYRMFKLKDYATGYLETMVERLLARDFQPLYCLQDGCNDVMKCGMIGGQHIKRSQLKSKFVIYEDETASLPFAHDDHNLDAEMYRFINALTLLLDHTRSHNDKMRLAVLELIKQNINKLVRCNDFKLFLVQHKKFCNNLEIAFAKDGLRLKVIKSAEGEYKGKSPVIFAEPHNEPLGLTEENLMKVDAE